MAPCSTAKSVMSHTSASFQSSTVVWTWKGRPASRQARMPATVASQAPAMPRKASWRAGSMLSRLMPMAQAPACLRRAATSGVMSVPFVPNTGRSPAWAAWDTSS